MPSPEPGPFGREPLLHVGWFALTTVQTCVRRLPRGACSEAMPPLESEGTRFASRFTELRTSRFRGEDAFRSFTPGLGIAPNFEGKVKAFTSPFLFPFR